MGKAYTIKIGTGGYNYRETYPLFVFLLLENAKKYVLELIKEASLDYSKFAIQEENGVIRYYNKDEKNTEAYRNYYIYELEILDAKDVEWQKK